MREAYPNELYHYGILGMHWGIRRFQNPDGTLTEEGKRRLQKSISNYEKAGAKASKYDKKASKYLSRSSKQNKKRFKYEKKFDKNPDDDRFYDRAQKYDKRYTKSLSRQAKYEKRRIKYERIMARELKTIKTFSEAEMDSDVKAILNEFYKQPVSHINMLVNSPYTE